MKFISKLIILSIVLTAIAAQAGTNINYRPLIKQLQSRIQMKKAKIKESKLLKFSASPAEPKAGEDISIFIQPLTGFTDSDILLTSTIDTVAKDMEHPAKELWVLDAGPYTQLRSHDVAVKIYLQDKNSAQLITDAIAVLDQAIADLDEQIANETDPDVIADLQAQKADKVAQRNELIATLDGLKTQIGEETFSFSISENTTLTGYPTITNINPNVVKTNTATNIAITGTNFTNLSFFSVSGGASTVTASTDTSLSVSLGALASGPHDIEIRTNTSGTIKNTILKNGIFVTSSDLANPNTPPTAIAETVTTPVSYGSIAQVTAINSFDSNAKPIRYEWRYLSVPAYATETAGSTVIGTNTTYSFTPSVPGYYILELKVIQTGGLQLTSAPSQAVIFVTAPVNRAPQGDAPPIYSLINQTKTSQIFGVDPDFWQEHNFFLIKQGTLGTASVNEDGLVTYVAGNTAGSDSIQIMVVDNGDAPLNDIITIPVTIFASNTAPVVGTPTAQILTENNPISVRITPANITDADGANTIAEIKYNMGDGTFEYAPISNPNFGFVTHNYLLPGTYSASINVKDVMGATTTTNFTVTVTATDIPTAKFSLDKYSCSSPCTVTADATAATDSNGISQYRWQWGDPTPEEVGNFVTRSHTYNSNGTYRIRLRTRDSNQAQGEGFATVYVGVTAPSTGSPSNPDFSTSTREVAVGTTVNFNGNRSFDPNPSGSITNYAWTSGACPEGTCTATGITAGFTYTQATNYLSFLNTTNALGGIASSPRGEIINVTTGHAPRPYMFVNRVIPPGPVVGTAPFVARFDGSPSFDYDGTITNYTWTIGSVVKTGQVLDYLFEAPGVYFVVLKTTDNSGNFPQRSQMVTVNPGSKKVSKKSREDEDPNAEQKNYLASACGLGNGEACSTLADIYSAEGDSFVAGKLKERACGLGFVTACGKK